MVEKQQQFYNLVNIVFVRTIEETNATGKQVKIIALHM